jgi:hypothetical protein
MIDERLERGSASVPGALEVDAGFGEDPAGVGAEHDDPSASSTASSMLCTISKVESNRISGAL